MMKPLEGIKVVELTTYFCSASQAACWPTGAQRD